MKGIKLFIAAFIMLAGSLFVVQPQTASAATSCVWKYASWGRGCVYYTDRQLVKTDDILSDGKCVFAAYYNTSRATWVELAGTRSCGAIVTDEANINGDSYSKIRLYTTTGNYLTLK